MYLFSGRTNSIPEESDSDLEANVADVAVPIRGGSQLNRSESASKQQRKSGRFSTEAEMEYTRKSSKRSRIRKQLTKQAQSLHMIGDRFVILHLTETRGSAHSGRRLVCDVFGSSQELERFNRGEALLSKYELSKALVKVENHNRVRKVKKKYCQEMKVTNSNFNIDNLPSKLSDIKKVKSRVDSDVAIPCETDGTTGFVYNTKHNAILVHQAGGTIESTSSETGLNVKTRICRNDKQILEGWCSKISYD